ncbi:MAG: hypothetical protein NZ845_01890 [Thermodesulfovibrio sp.]|nr:hypothetical protein [Thermodesulfovibrio sp.]MCX7724710.1 hypothetical protein [Thermodesulfovibrio sp.]MDW7971901.1 hypothetical protein [Thermodesulfovibrio sp.]
MEEKKPDPIRIAIVKMLPRYVKERLTIEEMNSLLYDEVLPDSLLEKLKDFLADVDNPSE